MRISQNFKCAKGALLLQLSLQVHAACECGYTINSTKSPSFAVFSDLLETDFLHLPNDALDWNKRNDTGWSWQVYNITAQVARGPYGKAMQADNVVMNPMKSQYDWAGPTELGGDGGLQIWVRAKDQVRDRRVSAGEVTSLENDMMYGSFRIGIKWTDVPGTCGSFFWYWNNSMEIDMEYLSHQQSPNATSNSIYHPINLVNQSPESVAAGFDAAGTPDFDVYPLTFDPSESFHEYRFDWTPHRISFLVDGAWMRDMTRYMPDGPGRLFINHWSNGDPAWSGGPPSRDALLTVSYIKAYFNSTNTSKKRAYAKDCVQKYPGAEAQAHTCQIPDQKTPPDQSGPNGNKTSKTFFFTPQQGGTNGGTASGRPESAGRTSSTVEGGLILSAMVLVAFLFS